MALDKSCVQSVLVSIEIVGKTRRERLKWAPQLRLKNAEFSNFAQDFLNEKHTKGVFCAWKTLRIKSSDIQMGALF